MKIKTKTKKVLTLFLLVLSLAALTLAGCQPKAAPASDNAAAAESGLQKIKSAGKIVLGTSAGFPPFEFVNDQNQIVGFDMDIGQKIADKLGVKLEIKDIQFDGLIAALQAGKIDMIIAGMSITPERAQNVDFSDPYFSGGSVILVHQDTNDINSLADLKGKKVAVQLGTTQEQAAEKIEGAEVVKLNLFTDAALQLSQKRVDAMLIDQTTAKAYASVYPNLKVVGEPFDNSEQGIAVQKGNKELLDEVNKVLKDLKQSGEMDQLIQKWFK